jgi:hypothetical protein
MKLLVQVAADAWQALEAALNGVCSGLFQVI